jgi:2-polyprenyl-3-methyl-5-hydroxy-6-metoxy-1,4-benzoquinol methylase
MSSPGGKVGAMTSNPCDACDGTRFRVIYPDHPILDGPLVACEGCGLVQVNPPRGRYQIADAASRQARVAAYARQAATVRANLLYRPEIEDAERAVRERFWAERLDRIERVATRGRLLEIGSDGQFLRLAAARGWSVTGVQPDVDTCADAAARFGLELVSATLGEAGFPEGSFDVVAMFHVIEHVPSPKALVGEAFRVLRPGGALFAETPNIDTLWFRLLGPRWRQLIPDHYWFFSPATLRKLLTRTGYVVDGVERVGKAVSLRLLVNRLERMARRPLPALRKLLTWFRLNDRVIWIKPGDIVLATARRPSA